VTLEPMPPSFAGVNALYSREFYEIVAARLAPGGIAAQWVPFHLLPPFHAASVAATFRSVFPDAVLWHSGDTGILLGRREVGPEPLGRAWPGLARAAERRPDVAARARSRILLDPEQLARWTARGAIVDDDDQLLAYGSIHRQFWTLGADLAGANALALGDALQGEPPGLRTR